MATYQQIFDSTDDYTVLTAGDILPTDEGFEFTVVAENAPVTDYQKKNAGGVKLFLTPYLIVDNINHYDARQWNIRETDVDCLALFMEMCQWAAENGHEIDYPDGTWIWNHLLKKGIKDDLKVNFSDDCIIINETSSQPFFEIEASDAQSLTLTLDAKRKDKVIPVASIAGVNIGDYFEIKDDTLIVGSPLDFSITAGGLYEVEDIDVSLNTITLDRPLRWDFPLSAGLEIRTYPKREITFDGGQWEFKNTAGSPIFYGLVCEFTNMKQWAVGFCSGFQVVSGTVNYSNCIQNDMRHGVLGARLLRPVVDVVQSYNCTAPADFGSWTEYPLYQDIFGDGCGAVISCHATINPTFIRITEINSVGPVSPRGMGVTVIDCFSHTVGASSSYFGRCKLLDQSIALESNHYIRNSTFLAPNTNEDGETLAIWDCGHVDLIDVNAGDITIGANTVKTVRGNIGSIRAMEDHIFEKLEIHDPNLDASLHHADNGYPLSLTLEGIRSVYIKGGTITGSTAGAAIIRDGPKMLYGHRVCENVTFLAGSDTLINGWGPYKNNWKLIDCKSIPPRTVPAEVTLHNCEGIT